MNLTKKALVAAGTVLLLSACDGAPIATPTSSPAPTRPPSSTASSADVARDKATAAYAGMWGDFAAAGKTSDWQSPRLRHHATGIALDKLSQSLYGDNYKGLVTKGEPIFRPSVSTVEPESDPRKIVVTDCGDSSNALKYRADNGQLADSKPGGRHLINAVVEKQADGSWKVSDFGVHEVGSC